MKLFFRIVLPILIGLSVIKAQTNQSVFSKDTLKILTVMVEFQADKYDATIGTGKFGSHYTRDYRDTIIDPLPHNAKYFDEHLLFAKNYFKKVSNGKLNIQYSVLPEVITVSKMMREYSPAYKSKDLTLLGDLSKESWELAYQKYPNLNFDDYDLFIIFHAGVSNSLNTGSYEINRNLPAIFIGENTLKKIYGNSFSGLINIGGSNYIRNSVIMPETESREITAIDESKTLLQLSINGELVANIASFLGLPDLYNTETGISAIGRFGLMDGQSMVANLGLFPPEPSAWEKMYLGWITPAVVNIKDIKAGITAQRSAAISDTTIVKIPINDYEYFLVENRQQDAARDGFNLVFKKGDDSYNDLLQADTSGLFNFQEKNIKGGVLVDVDEYDASVPGNGIVIWHIDEKIIAEKFNTGDINNNRSKKGVSVVEADGITDIGEITHSIFGDIIGEGSLEDFWYSGNKAKYYKNKFYDDSKPNAKSNSGANSFIVMQNFSVSAPKMTFNLSFGGAILSKTKVKLNLSQSSSALISVKEVGNVFNYLLNATDLLKCDSEGRVVKSIPNFSEFNPLSFSLHDTLWLAGGKGNILKLWDVTNDKVYSFSLHANISTPLLFKTNTNGTSEIILGLVDGKILRFRLIPEHFSNGSILFSFYTPFNMNGKIIQMCITDDYLSAVSETGFSDSRGYQVAIANRILAAVLTKDKSGNYINILLSEGNRFYIISNDIIISEFRINEASDITKFILADIGNNGENSIIFTVSDKLYAVNQKGIVLDNYPATLSLGNNLQPEILSFNYDSDKAADFVIFTSTGDICFVNGKTGKSIKELSLSTGSKTTYANLHAIDPFPRVPINDDLGLSVITENNTLYTWNLLLPAEKKVWYSQYGDYSNSSFLSQPLNEAVFEKLLPEGKVYNWPNPVYGSETNIRFNVNEDSRVNIKVFDMGGQIVAELQKEALMNLDNEVIWNVRDVKSGAYFARVEAVSKSGKSEIKIVKIVVIK